MEPSGSETLTAIRVMNDAHGLMRRGEKCLGRFHPKGLPGTGDFVFPLAGLGNDSMGHGFFMDPAGRELIATADLEKRHIERIMGYIDKIQLHLSTGYKSFRYECNAFGYGTKRDIPKRSGILKSMRLLGNLMEKTTDAASWIKAIQRAGYTAAGNPLPLGNSDEAALDAYIQAAEEAGIPFAEVGAWSNPIDPDPVKAREAIALCKQALRRADRLGARCCVNIAGSRNPVKWDGPHPDNFSPETFDSIVRSIQEIIDEVKPTRTFYTLETMPWIFPSSPDEYLDLIQEIDRPAFAVHLDPVNMINCPARAYRSGDFIRECFEKLGPYIRSCHAKDFILRNELTLHIDEFMRPGAGMLDYDTYLREIAKLDPDTTLVIEHIPDEEHPIALEYLHAKLKKLNLA